MKRTIKKAIALAVTTVMALSISVPTLPSTYASTTEENMVIESTTEISTQEAITTEVVTSEVTTENISTEVTTEATTEATEEKADEGSTEVTTEALPIPSEEMLYELLFDEEWVSELTEDEIKEMYGFDSREEFEQYVEMVVGSNEKPKADSSISTTLIQDIPALLTLANGDVTVYRTDTTWSSAIASVNPEAIEYFSASENDYTYVNGKLSQHHFLIAEDSAGKTTVAYCMQPYMAAPGLNGTTYAEGHIFPKPIAVAATIASLRFGYGGTNADPNIVYKNGATWKWEDDGGTYGTYVVPASGGTVGEATENVKVVRGLNIGGKIYPMGIDQARAMTGLLVHSVSPDSTVQDGYNGDLRTKNITAISGTNGDNLYPAYNHMLKIANGTRYQYESEGLNSLDALKVMDSKDYYKSEQEFSWEVYNVATSKWESFADAPNPLTENYVDSSDNVKFRVTYTSNNMCNKLIDSNNNGTSGNITIEHTGSQLTVWDTKDYFDYFTVSEDTGNNTPFTVSYSGLKAKTQEEKDYWAQGIYTYQEEVFIQDATITVKASDLSDTNKTFKIKAATQNGATATKFYENENYAARMYKDASGYDNWQDIAFTSPLSLVTSKNTSLTAELESNASVYLKKVSSNPELTNGNANYSAAGCIYNLYEGSATSGEPYAVFTTDENGISNTEEIPTGTYTAVEIQAPPGFKLNPNPITIEIKSEDVGTTKEFIVTDEPMLGSIQVLKVLDNEELDDNECYDKKATYVLRNAQGTQVGTFTTDAVTGLSNVITDLPLGNYTVVETVASKGCKLDTTVHNVSLTTENSSVNNLPVQVKSVETTENDPVAIEIYKIDANGNKVSGGASLAGAEFTITYYDTLFYTEAEIPAKYERQWVVATKYDESLDTYKAFLTDEYLVSGSELYKSDLGNVYVPLGTITIQETKTPEGYLVDGIFKDENGNEIPNGLYITQIETDDEDIPAVVGGHKYSISNTVKRGDLAFTKIDHVTLEPMGGIPFKITSATTGESHIYITDDRGVLSTSSSHVKHSKDTNANDGAVKDENGYYSNLTYCGAWFSGTKDGNINELEDGVGALPFDTYIIEELPCAANKDKTLIETQELVISEDGVEVNDGVYTNVPLPSISTVEKDAETGTHISVADDKVILTDTIHYEYFEAGAKYTAFGVIVDKETKKPLKDAAGNYIISSETFDVDKNWKVNKFEKKGDVDVSFTFDGTGFDGKSFVVFEYVFEGDVTNTHKIIDASGNINDTGCFAKHAEINSVDQTGMFPSMATKAWTVESENNTLAMDENVNVVDTVTMENLIVGEDYVLTATIINKATGETLKNEEGKEITGTLEFTATKTNDNKDVKFPTLKRKLFENEGSDFVIFEELTWKKSTGDVYYSKHTDINDTDQTLSLVTIGTTATYKGDKVAPATENITITDVVEYKNLTIGKEYTLNGVLHIKSTGKPLLHADGTEVTATKTFTAKAKNGKESLDFTFDATLLQGESVVAFEYLKDKDIEVATHTELDDEDQTVEFPKISTTLVESETGLPMVYINKPVKLVDTVEYKNFIPGREYRMVGVLINKSIGLPLWDSSKNTIITAEITFTPEEKDGTVNVVFYFDVNNVNLKNEDGSLADIVCFENCYFTDEETSEEIRFAHHEDIESVSQTIRVPSGRTTAKDGTNGTHTGTPEKKATIVDTVYYNNLIPGKTYRIEGKLWTKDKDGNEVPFLDGGKEVVSSVKFTPTEAIGSIEMVFEFNASSLKSSGTTITVFEDCYYEDTDLLVFTHSEIDDKDQQINYPSIITEIKDKNGNKSLEPEHKYTLIDTITYENLTVGETYVIEGVLMEKVETRDEHGTVLSVSEKEYVNPDGNKSTAVVEFTPTEANGKVDVSFEFYTSEDTYNKTFVCFEKIYTKATHTEICEHTDINDSKQSFTVTDQVKTGDGPLGIIIALMCFALAGIIFMISHKGRNKNIPLIKM